MMNDADLEKGVLFFGKENGVRVIRN